MFFDENTYPDPKGMIDILHQEGFHLMISIWAGLGPATPIYQDMEKKGFLYPPAGWAGFKYYDAYNPAANDLYWQYVSQGLFSKGMDGWWMDSTEPDIVNALTKESEEYEMKRVGTNYLGSFARYLNPYSLLDTEVGLSTSTAGNRPEACLYPYPLNLCRPATGRRHHLVG